MIEKERRKEEDKLEEDRWQRANLDFDRMKVLHEKANKENVKIAETCKNEIKVILKQKLEADNRYHDLVNEMEKYREKERILLNTFDLWKSQFELNTKNAEESSKSPDDNYECSKCVYEANTQADLREHVQDTHTQEEFKCKHCGHIVLSQSDLKGHIEAYHVDSNGATIYMCTKCDEEFSSKIKLEVHTVSNHSKENSAFKCDKCEFEGESAEDLKRHRQSEHYHFRYFCCACDYETLNRDVLIVHKVTEHKNPFLETRKEKEFPPPPCNFLSPSHTNECCDRKQGTRKPKFYSMEERSTNGICINWNKGSCEYFELCKYSHTEIQECKFANFCSRSNCKYWHNIPGKFPFLVEESLSKKRKW